MLEVKLASLTPSPLLAGFNNTIMVLPIPTNRHERREQAKTGIIRRQK